MGADCCRFNPRFPPFIAEGLWRIDCVIIIIAVSDHNWPHAAIWKFCVVLLPLIHPWWANDLYIRSDIGIDSMDNMALWSGNLLTDFPQPPCYKMHQATNAPWPGPKCVIPVALSDLDETFNEIAVHLDKVLRGGQEFERVHIMLLYLGLPCFWIKFERWPRIATSPAYFTLLTCLCLYPVFCVYLSAMSAAFQWHSESMRDPSKRWRQG